MEDNIVFLYKSMEWKIVCVLGSPHLKGDLAELEGRRVAS